MIFSMEEKCRKNGNKKVILFNLFNLIFVRFSGILGQLFYN